MPDTIFTTPKGNARLARLWEDLLADAVHPRPAAAQGRTAAMMLQEVERREPALLSRNQPVSRSWRADLAGWLRSLVELEDAVVLSADEANSEPSPFRWEPKRTWLSVPGRSNPPFSKASDARRLAPRRPNIPIRPLHKQPFYRRFVFYLRRWLNRSVWQEPDPAEPFS
jgi:hypothetical protein